MTFTYEESKEKIALSAYITEREYPLDVVRFKPAEDKSKATEIILRFSINKGNPGANDTKGDVEAIGHGVEILSKSKLSIKHGEKILLKISNQDIQPNAYIDFFANDNDYWGFYDLENIHCGRVQIEDKPIWHDPVDNPQLCVYTKGGNEKGWHGSFGAKIRPLNTNINHNGVDLFAIPKTNVYACVDAVVARVYTSTSLAGRVVSLKVKDKKKFLERKKNPFTAKYKDKGEDAEKDFDTEKDIYIVYMHLHESKVKEKQEVKCGDIIALSGVSGYNGVAFNTCNPHLHFEISNQVSAAGISGKCNPLMFFTVKYEDELSAQEKNNQNEAKNKKNGDWTK